MEVLIFDAADPRETPGPLSPLIRRYRDRLCQGFSAEADWPGLWITVNHRAVAAGREALAADGPLLAPGVMTFDGLADAILTRSRRPIVPLSPIQRRRLLRQLIDAQAAAGQFDYHAAVVHGSGFLAEVDRLIADQKRNYIWPEQFANRSSDQRHAELARLYDRYQQTLHQAGLYDTQGCFWAAGDALRADELLAQGTRVLVVDRFTDFTEAQWRVLELLVPRCEEVLVTLPLDAELVDPAAEGGRHELFAKTRETLARLRENFPVRVASSSGPSAPAAALASEGLMDPLSWLRQNLFRQPADEPPAEWPQGRPAIEVIEATGDDSEAQEVARRVKERLLAGCPAEEIVVARRRLSAEADRLRAVFADYGVPCHFDHTPPLIVAPTVRACLALLRIVVEDWPYRELLRVINQSQFSAISDAERRAAELAIRRVQVAAGREKILALLERAIDPAEGGSADRTARRAYETLSRLGDALDLLPQSATPARWTQQLSVAAAALGLKLGADSAGRLFLRGLESLATLDRWTGRRRTSLSASEYLAAATLVARELSQSSRSGAGLVAVVEADTVRGMTPRHLFLMGLGEQSFPGALRSGQMAEPASATTHATDEMLLFYQIVTQASETLTLSYAGLDARAQQLEPSPYLLEIERTFAPRKLPRVKLELQSGVARAMPLSRTEERIAAVAEVGDGRPDALVNLCRVGAAGVAIAAGLESVASRARRDAFGSWEGLFEGDATRQRLAERFGPERYWSTSQLEKYAACPFKFLGEYGLNLKPLPDLALEADARDRGSLLHMVLAVVHRELIDADDATLRETILERFLETLSRVVEEHSPAGLEGALREIQRRELVRHSENLAAQTAAYQKHYDQLDVPPRPAHFEVRFGPSRTATDKLDDPQLSTETPFLLELSDEQIAITGQIDRIDLGQEAGTRIFNIIDYKSGVAKKFSPDEAVAGRLLQLPLYALVAEQMLLKDAAAQAWTAGYWNIQGNGFIPSKRSPQALLRMRERDEQGRLQDTRTWQALRSGLTERIESLIHGIRGGAFPVFNEDKKCTQYCELSKICRIAQIRSLEKQWPPEENAGQALV